MTDLFNSLLNRIATNSVKGESSESIQVPNNTLSTSTTTTNDTVSLSRDGKIVYDPIKKAHIVNLNIDNIHMAEVPCRNKSGVFELSYDEPYERSDHDADLEKFRVDALNDEQAAIFNYLCENTTKIVLIQAGPGCGKSFTLKTTAYGMNNGTKFDVIIYKLDLLAAFSYCARRFTVAKFIMRSLDLTFYRYQAVDKLLSSRMTAYEFMLVIISMLKRLRLPNIKGGIVFIDEYTIISKPLLLVMLMAFEHHNIGAVICGDRNQLQNIFNSRHATLPSYRIAASFASREFQLFNNVRCSDKAYNEIINYISQFSCSRRLDSYAFAMVSAIFLRQLIEPPQYHQIHLAGTHQELSDLAHTLVCNNGYATDFYAIDKSNSRDKDLLSNAQSFLQPPQALLDYQARIRNNEPPRVDKFLPYIPLVIGGRYYVSKHSEYSQGVLVSINANDTVTMRMDNGSEVTLERSNEDCVMFDEHRKFLMNGENGKLYAFPIYPAEFMSIHMCQGCTIVDNLDLILNNTQYSGLYVALSRVKTPNQIARVTIPDQIAYIVSSIINFPKHIQNQPLTVDDLKRGMETFVFYNVNAKIEPFLPLIHDFILSSDVNVRAEKRKTIIELAKNYPQTRITMDFRPADDTSNLLTMSLIIKYRDIFKALSCIDEIDRNVWLHEFILATPEMECLLPENFSPNSQEYIPKPDYLDTNELIRMAGLNFTYSMEMSTMEYIEATSKTSIRLNELDRQRHKCFMVREISDSVFYENTPFCAKVYNRLLALQREKRKDLTTISTFVHLSSEWLINELNELVTMGRITSEPPKNEIIQKDDDRFKPKRRRTNAQESTTTPPSSS